MADRLQGWRALLLTAVATALVSALLVAVIPWALRAVLERDASPLSWDPGS
ncbi:MAG TPA: hypothetical protein VGR21_09660 [Cryptosporangiaceae bacterium]|nr:hypothetical protein [Cryptosporangiaceae bacterium]